jgi:hypothetical protein
VVSKYIGETEKNLRRVFDAAEEGGAILLFDEADALFGKRSEVKDSHDRYANIEVSYLLQRMEAYRGLAILTTNMKDSLDTAFLRRLRFIVQFPFPDAGQRAEIWRRLFPAETPTEGLDPAKLARLNVTGGNIRNIALATRPSWRRTRRPRCAWAISCVPPAVSWPSWRDPSLSPKPGGGSNETDRPAHRRADPGGLPTCRSSPHRRRPGEGADAPPHRTRSGFAQTGGGPAAGRRADRGASGGPAGAGGGADRAVGLPGDEVMKDELQRKETGSQAPPVVHEHLRTPARPPGAESPAPVAESLGHDFSRVAVHLRRRRRKSMGGFEESELQAYLQGLDRRGKIEDNRKSDDKARAIVKEWIWGISPFDLTPQRKILMIREMQSGFTGDEDERAILDLLEGSKDEELLVIFGPRGIGAKSLRSDFHGADEDLLLEFFSRRFEGGYEALRRGKVEIRKRRSPGAEAAVADARRRLKILHNFEKEWTERQARRTRIQFERTTSAEKRQAMDQGDPISQARGEMEPERISGINKRPLSIEVSEDQVVFRIRFHARFEGNPGASDFEELRTSLADGARMVWNQRLSGEVFRGRNFFVVPEVSAAPAKRDPNFWLITVRPTDTSGVNYPACPQLTAPTGIPISATEPECDGGVMSIPPSHRKKPDVLGHELLHLLGLLDRYVLQIFQATPTSPPTGFATTAMRETKGRPDPLGAEHGTVLAEDLSLLFDRLGVYDMEESRGLETLRVMERSGLTIDYVRAEIERLEELIRRGGERELLFKPRKDFIDVMTRQAEDL